MYFSDLELGEQFKMSEGSGLTYEKTNDTDAQCLEHTHAVQLGTDHNIYPQQE